MFELITTTIFIDLLINRNNIETKQKVISQFYILLDKFQNIKTQFLVPSINLVYRYLERSKM